MQARTRRHNLFDRSQFSILVHPPTFSPISANSGDIGYLFAKSVNFGRRRPVSGNFGRPNSGTFGRGQFRTISASLVHFRPMFGDVGQFAAISATFGRFQPFLRRFRRRCEMCLECHAIRSHGLGAKLTIAGDGGCVAPILESSRGSVPERMARISERRAGMLPTASTSLESRSQCLV